MNISMKKRLSNQRNWDIFRLKGTIATVEELLYGHAIPDNAVGDLHAAHASLKQALSNAKWAIKDAKEREQKKASSAG